ncbi:MAG: VacJ family lipoprotein [Alphaproteobacteria bacterium]|nr:VacJ family lipoprotein [Alphaproteobacteria bacterium]
MSLLNIKTASFLETKAKRLGLALSAVVLLTLPGCASTQESEIYEAGILISDPYENYNRHIFAFNQAVDDVLINPLIETYRFVPKPARTGVRNVLTNLNSPVILANQLLQGDLEGAGDVFVRFSINTLLGVGGIFDLAGYEGIEYEHEDFGQTLAVWGVDHGPYIVAPFIGPSSLRDYTGFAVDGYADPLRHYWFNTDEEHLYYTKAGIGFLDLRESLYDTLKDLDSSSIDYYAAVRSIYYQRRAALANDQKAVHQEDEAFEIPNYDE